MNNLHDQQMSDLYKEQIEEIKEERLNDWECDFISDINNILIAGGQLTSNQAATLSDIWHKQNG